MNKFEKYNLALSKKQEELILDYLDKIEKYVSENWIEKELYEDIEEMVFENILSDSDVTEFKIIKIIKEVWEPEIIFSDYKNEDNSIPERKFESEMFYETLMKNNWFKDNDSALFLWISKSLSEKIWISIFMTRIFILILLIPFGISIWIYVLLWLIFPLKWKDYSWFSTLSYIRIQIFSVIKYWMLNLTKSFLSLITLISKYFFILIWFMIKSILPIIRIIFFSIIGLIFLFLTLTYIFNLSLIFTNFSIYNIEITSVIPEYSYIWVISWIIFSSIFCISSFLYWFYKKWFNKYLLGFWLISLIITIFIYTSIFLDLTKRYLQENDYLQTWVIEWSFNKDENIKIDLEKILRPEIKEFVSRYKDTKVIYTDEEIIRYEIVNSVLWDKEIFDKYSKWISELNISVIWNEIFFKYENNLFIKNPVPISEVKRQIIIYIPRWYNYEIINDYFYYRD